MALLRGLSNSFRHFICCDPGAEDDPPRRPPTVELSPANKEIVLQLFRLIDTDGSRTISVQETAHWWSSFSKVNTKAMFTAVDIDGNGEISEEEWVQFWTNVRNSGYSDEEIAEELGNIKDKTSWASLDFKAPV